ncbi:MAG TPA: hypothetical protein VGB08_05640 [Allosphingosinicella sp.]|jgi:hypothetical protein
MRTILIMALCGSSLATAGCLRERPAPPPPPPDPVCHPFSHFTFLDTDTRIYRQGSQVRLTPRVNQAPGGTPELPRHCVSDWTVSGPATLSADRSALTIAADAPVGSIVTVGFRHDETPVTARFRVIGRDDVVLIGARSQQAIEGCSVPDPVGELEFGEDRFSVTFRPFESYRDYWGTYSFDAATGALRMTVEGGNFVPPSLDLEGRAELVAGRLVLRDMFLGSREGSPPQTSCTYRF